MNVAFCCDQFGLPGLYLSLFTLVEANPEVPLKVFLIHEGLTGRVLEFLQTSVEELSPNAKMIFREFSTSGLGFAKSFHGNYMTYARLFLAELLPEIDRVIYLDSDLLVNCPIEELWQIELDGCLIAAVPIGPVEWVALESNFLLSIGLSKSTTYFGAGVLVLDLALWRARQTTKACINFLAANSSQCRTADQTVLNGLFSREYVQIPNHFNIIISPDSPSQLNFLPSGILHFVASPKPWDFLGKQLHSNWALFDDASRRLQIPSQVGGLFSRLVRTFRISRSYSRLLHSRLKKSKTVTHVRRRLPKA
jgi:lipopolysaccharide biosynthesis glycosyltransferase